MVDTSGNSSINALSFIIFVLATLEAYNIHSKLISSPFSSRSINLSNLSNYLSLVYVPSIWSWNNMHASLHLSSSNVW